MTARRADVEAAVDRLARRGYPAQIQLKDGSEVAGRIVGQEGGSVHLADADRKTVDIDEIADITSLIVTEGPE